MKAVNDWVDTTGKKHCEDVRTLTFHTVGTSRVIDFDVTVKATASPVEFGDTKEGRWACGCRRCSTSRGARGTS